MKKKACALVKKISSNQQQIVSVILRGLMLLSIFLTVGILFSILVYVLIKGIPHLTPELFAWKYTTENVSMMPAIINTLMVTGLSLLIAVPVGIGAAIYLTEYAGRGNKLVSVIRITAETLSGIPSIVYGLFGFLFFVLRLHWNYSILSGSFTLAIMILPLIMRTTEEALKAVPDSNREGSFGLGAGRLRTVFRITLPAAMPGVLSGIILGIGRITGETAALLYTAGTAADIASDVMQPGRTLAVHMYCLINEGLYTNQAYATAVVLLVMVVGLNALSSFLVKKMGVKK